MEGEEQKVMVFVDQVPVEELVSGAMFRGQD